MTIEDSFINMLPLLLFLILTVFALGFSLPFFARRFVKFLPADPGTALVRSFHIPRFARSPYPPHCAERRRLWKKLIGAGVMWGFLSIIAFCGLFVFQMPLSLFLFLWICALLACIDEKIHILPDVLTFPLIISGFLFSVLNLSGISPSSSAGGAVAGFLLPTITSAVMTPIRPRSLGGGDFKMLAGIGAWLGFMGLSFSILLSFVFFSLIALAKHRKEGPYGTSLLLAVITVLIMQMIPAFQPLFILV